MRQEGKEWKAARTRRAVGVSKRSFAPSRFPHTWHVRSDVSDRAEIDALSDDESVQSGT